MRVYLAMLLLAVMGAACTRSGPATLQGYIEGEFVYVASPFAGTLTKLLVQRGTEIKAGAPLFELEHIPESAAVQEAKNRLAQAQASLEDLRKGKRPSEIDAIEAQLQQSRAALDLAEKEAARQEKLWAASGATTEQDVDRAKSARDQGRQRVAQLEAELATARLGSRSDQVEAAQANVEALQAALVKAEWNLQQKRQDAPEAGAVFDTLFREGEWVPAGRPVVVLLPPRHVKLRVFVPETRLGSLHAGDPLRVQVDGVAGPLQASVSFISPRAEYTPPVIYSRENRAKLVFLVEATFAPEVSARLHPGQPVDVLLPGAAKP